MSDIHGDIWQAQATLARQLLQWGRVSMGAGALIRRLPDRFYAGFGTQAIGWGAINSTIGRLGLSQARRRSGVPEAHTAPEQRRARLALRRLLWINVGLDAGYVAGGLSLAATKGRSSRFRKGSGWGIAFQGAFLLLFDLAHARLLGSDPGEA